MSSSALALLLAVPAVNVLPSTVFAAGVVHLRAEDEAAALLRPIDRPAREDARHLDDVLLRVAAVDAERVQLHQLARVVLVEAALRPLLRLRLHLLLHLREHARCWRWLGR